MNLLQSNAFIDGTWVKGKKTFPVLNPATLEKIIDVADCDASEADDAVRAAVQAFPLWRDMLVVERVKILLRWRDLIVEHKHELAALLTKEQGKPIKESLAEISSAETIEWAAEEAKRAYGETIPAFKDNSQVLITKEAVGVVTAITPWNFPHSMITRKVGPALAAGCTVVLKPAQDTPLSALALAVLAEKAGFPKGVLNIVTCSQENTEAVGKVLSTHKDVRKISFTGSTKVGRLLMEQGAATVKKISLELGGNAPLIIFDTADLEKAVDGAIACKFRNAGQTCICANRIFVQAGIYDRFVARFKEKIEALKIGNGADENVTTGPLINKSAVEKVEKLVRDAETKGAQVVTGGHIDKAGELFYTPTLLIGMTKDMDAFEQEIFGPVAPIYKFEIEEDVIALANDTIFGLAAYFYSNDLGQCFRVSRGLEYGMVGVNDVAITSATIPFGGYKQSGIGREGGPASLGEFMETKYTLMSWLTKA